MSAPHSHGAHGQGTHGGHDKAGLIECPSCHKKNIPGDDVCASCGHDLHEESGPSDKVSASLTTVPVDSLAHHPAVAVSADETVLSVVKDMAEERRGEVVVLEHGKVAGIFTERDLVYRVLDAGKDIHTTRIGDVMTRNVESLKRSDPVAVALHKMAMIGCRHMPIIENDECLGILSVRGILTHLAGHLRK